MADPNLVTLEQLEMAAIRARDNVPTAAVPVVNATSTDGVAYTGTLDGVTELTTGVAFSFIPDMTSTSTAPTLDLNGLGAKTIKRRLSGLSSTTTAGYAANWLYTSKPQLLMYDGTYWIAVNQDKPMASDLYGDVGGLTAATATLTTSGWTLGSDDRYYQTVSVAGVTTDATQVIVVDAALSGTDLDADAAVLEAWQNPSAHNVTQGDGTLIFYSYDIPAVNIPINVGVS